MRGGGVIMLPKHLLTNVHTHKVETKLLVQDVLMDDDY